MSKRYQKILLVGDYGTSGDLAFNEVKQKLYELAAKKRIDIRIDTVGVDPFDTAMTAAVVAQAAEDGKYDVIYHNTAPRKDNKDPRNQGKGEPLAYACYQKPGHNDVQIIGVNAGGKNETVNTFALLPQSCISGGVRLVDCGDAGSQFRSRDVFPPSVIDAVAGEVRLKEKVDVPEPEGAAEAKALAAFEPAKERLREAYDNSQLASHGDAVSQYVTIIAPAKYTRQYANPQGSYGEPEIDVLPLKSTGEHAWIEGGFAAAQLALNSTAKGARKIFVLVGHQNQDLREVPYTATLDNGVIVATDTLDALYFVRDHIDHINKHYADASHHNDYPVKGEDLRHLKQLSLPADITPAYVDGYGNVKLAITYPKVKEHLDVGENTIGKGQRLRTKVRINGHQIDAFIVNNSFDVRDGEAALSQGSSGWAPKDSGDRQFFAEIFLRGGNASKALGGVHPGRHILINKGAIENIEPGSEISDAERHASPERSSGVAI